MVEQDTALEKLLYKMPQGELIKLAKRYKVRRYSTWQKEELATEISRQIQGMALEYLTLFSQQDIMRLEDLMEEELVIPKEELDISYKRLMELGFIYKQENEIHYTLLVAKEITSLYETYRADKLFRKERTLKYNLIVYRNGLLNMYGMLELCWLHHLYNRDHEESISFKRMLEVLRWAEDIYGGCKLIQDYIVQESLYCVSYTDFKELKEKVKDKTYYEPSKSLILLHSKEIYFEKSRAMYILKDHLKADYTLDDSKIEQALLLFVLTARVSPYSGVNIMEEVMLRWQNIGIYVTTKEQFRELSRLVVDALRDVRRWYSKGFTLNEQAPITYKTRVQKHELGRNDLCYCGSGKKYKKCCME